MRVLIFLVASCCIPAPLANDLWAHKIGSSTDVAYGDHPQQVMDMHAYGQWVGEPDYFIADTAPRETLVWIHGGGWLSGDKDQETVRIQPFLERGWNVFNINYRQGPDTAPQAVDDVMCAYQAIIETLGTMQQPLDRVVVAGMSAGGHLALVIGLLNSRGEHPCKTENPPRAIVNWFGITDIEMVDEHLSDTRPDTNYARTWAGGQAGVIDVSADYSPMYLISNDAPPIITIHGTDDTVVPYEQAESFHASLNTPNLLHTVPGGKHLGFSNNQFVEAYETIFSFLDEH
jgi:acetyl esterase/lipase